MSAQVIIDIAQNGANKFNIRINTHKGSDSTEKELRIADKINCGIAFCLARHAQSYAKARKELEMTSESETIEDIVSDIRSRNGCGVPLDGESSHCLAEDMLKLADRVKAAHQREVAELRECLREAIREKCPFTRMSCKHGEPCDYECGTVKWRKALQDEGGAKCGV